MAWTSCSRKLRGWVWRLGAPVRRVAARSVDRGRDEGWVVWEAEHLAVGNIRQAACFCCTVQCIKTFIFLIDVGARIVSGEAPFTHSPELPAPVPVSHPFRSPLHHGGDSSQVCCRRGLEGREVRTPLRPGAGQSPPGTSAPTRAPLSPSTPRHLTVCPSSETNSGVQVVADPQSSVCQPS